MFGKKAIEAIRRLNLLSLSIPAGIIIANTIFALQPLIRQAFVVIMLVWFGVEAFTGFECLQ